jgi:hypothetical protein
LARTHRAARSRPALTIGRVQPRHTVQDDVARPSRPDLAYCRDAAGREAVCDRAPTRAWRWLGDFADVVPAGSLAPRVLLPGLIDEPRLSSREIGVPLFHRALCERRRAPDSRTSP